MKTATPSLSVSQLDMSGSLLSLSLLSSRVAQGDLGTLSNKTVISTLNQGLRMMACLWRHWTVCKCMPGHCIKKALEMRNPYWMTCPRGCIESLPSPHRASVI